MNGLLNPDGPGALQNQRAVVTGAARGLGQHIAVELARAGAEVTIADVRDGSRTVELIESDGGTARTVHMDVSDKASVDRQLADSARQLDVLVTCAAIYGKVARIEELNECEMDSVLDINVKGTLLCIQSALPALRAHGGRIVAIGSVAGKAGGVLAGPHYVASKGAVHAIVKWLAKTEAANGISANGVAPGVVDTDMIRGKGYQPDYCPLGRFADPREIAYVAAFLASPAASYMTGAVVDVNGGSFIG